MNIRTRTTALLIAALTVTVPLAWTGTANAAGRPTHSRSLQAMARYYHCDIVATPGPDYFHGNRVRSWLIGVDGKAIYVIDPASVGWEPPIGPRGRTWVKAVCQIPAPR